MRLQFDAKGIPVFIVSFNRLTCLKKTVEWFEKSGYENIQIIDNCSSFPPLLEYYEECGHVIHRMEHNYGHLVLWESHRFNHIIDNNHYILTDGDILPAEECPTDVSSYLYNILQRYRNFTKAGLSLKIDDIPQYYALKSKILELEKPFWEHSLADGLYEAAIDTTFALYRPGIGPDDSRWWRSIRTAPPYTARHLPWYADTSKPSEEDLYYQKNLQEMSSYWSVTDLNVLKEHNVKLQNEVWHLRKELDGIKNNYWLYKRRVLRKKVKEAIEFLGLKKFAKNLRNLF